VSKIYRFSKDERKILYTKFIENLRNLKKRRKGEFVLLKRALGKLTKEALDALPVFYRCLPYKKAVEFVKADVFEKELIYNREIYFLIATLFSFNNRPFKGSFGKTMQQVFLKTGSENIRKRMIRLVSSDFDYINDYAPGGGTITRNLEQCIRLASSYNVGVDWIQLLEDLIYWTHNDKFIQDRWIRDFSFYNKS